MNRGFVPLDMLSLPSCNNYQDLLINKLDHSVLHIQRLLSDIPLLYEMEMSLLESVCGKVREVSLNRLLLPCIKFDNHLNFECFYDLVFHGILIIHRADRMDGQVNTVVGFIYRRVDFPLAAIFINQYLGCGVDQWSVAMATGTK